MDLHLALLSIIEGITEFLPISSTAHLILISKIFNVDTLDLYIKFYILFIQFGALLAGIILFTKKVLTNKKTFINITISFIPTAILGFVFYKLFKHLLEGNMILIAGSLFIGGLIIIYLEDTLMKKYLKSKSKLDFRDYGKDNISVTDAFIIGCAQAIAIIPGVSRSGASIVAGLSLGIKKALIVEYTFLLALPTLGAAVLYDAYKNKDYLANLHSWNDLIYGFLISFIVSFLILYFIEKHLSRIPLKAFGWYRIILACFILIIFIPIIPNKINANNDNAKNVFNIRSIIPIIDSIELSKDIQISPANIYPGDPVYLTINSTSTPVNILFDDKEISFFKFENKYHALIAIPFEEKKSDHVLSIEYKDGSISKAGIKISQRIKIEKPLGIPDKLGGNTKQASQNLVNNLALENADINNITYYKKTNQDILWNKSFLLPLKNTVITDNYGYSRNTIGKTIIHKGTDLRAERGSEVYAMNDGIIIASKKYTVYGNTIIIDHGLGISSMYMHLSELKVKLGDKVKRGDLIGLSGDTGYAESPHLHISIKIKGISIDPIRFLSFFI